MTDTTLSYEDLKRLTLDFTETFNRNDLDGTMRFFAPDAVYDQFDGAAARGQEAIRAAFQPQFDGAFGQMRFLEEDLFVDAATAKTMVSWTCTLATKRGPAGWRGLDLLHFDAEGLIAAKLTYAKTKTPLLEALTTDAS